MSDMNAGHDPNMEIRCQILLQELCEELDKLADLMADSQELRVGETQVLEMLNAFTERYWPPY